MAGGGGGWPNSLAQWSWAAVVWLGSAHWDNNKTAARRGSGEQAIFKLVLEQRVGGSGTQQVVFQK